MSKKDAVLLDGLGSKLSAMDAALGQGAERLGVAEVTATEPAVKAAIVAAQKHYTAAHLVLGSAGLALARLATGLSSVKEVGQTAQPIVAPPADPGLVYTGTLDPDTLTLDDWIIYGLRADLRARTGQIFSKHPVIGRNFHQGDMATREGEMRAQGLIDSYAGPLSKV